MICGLSIVSGVRQTVVQYDTQELVIDFYARMKREHSFEDLSIDDVFYNQAPEITWKDVIAPGGVLVQAYIDLLNSDDPFIAHKIQFVNNEGFSMLFEDISLSIRAIDTGYSPESAAMSLSPMDIVHVNYGHKYPETFIEECIQQTPQWKQLHRQLEACHCESYFGDGFARMLSDQECNGVLTTGFIGEVFLVKWNKGIGV